jgi:hypothetical protein
MSMSAPGEGTRRFLLVAAAVLVALVVSRDDTAWSAARSHGFDPARLVGKAALAYQVAREFPEILDQLYCYGHGGRGSLLSCYRDGLAATSNICLDEALDASALVKAGLTIDGIRAEIDAKYAR